MPQHNPSFDAFIRRLYDTSVARQVPEWESYNKELIEKTFKDFLKNKELDQPGEEASVSFIEQEHEQLGINMLSPDQINAMPMHFAMNTTFGWHIEAPADNIYMRVSSSRRGRDKKTKGRPAILAGSSPVRQIMTEHVGIDVCPYLTPMEKIPLLEKEELWLSMINFNFLLVGQSGFPNLSLMNVSKPSDYGIRFFVKEKEAWQEKKNIDYMSLSYKAGEFKIAGDEKVTPVPYLFDTEDLQEEPGLDQQRTYFQSLLDNPSLLAERYKETRFGTKITFSENFKRDMIECYLTYDSANPIQIVPV